jgi:hypothetical protein
LSRKGERQRERRAELRAYMQDIKLARGCIDCDYREHPEALDFDHARGEKHFALSSALNRNISRARIDAEIAKCDVVCANCHRIRTAKRRNGID